MLLPSALPCDMRRPSSRQITPSRLFLTTPPPSTSDLPTPPPPTTTNSSTLLGTCRALQTLLNGSSTTSATTPPPSLSPFPHRAKPSRLQSPAPIRSRSNRTTPRRQPERDSSSKPSPRPRGVNKRRRSLYESDMDVDGDGDGDRGSRVMRFSTPKRQRHLPYDLPLGLSRQDFYSLNSPPSLPDRCADLDLDPGMGMGTGVRDGSARLVDPDTVLPSIEEEEETAANHNPPANEWSPEDDRRLVQLVLDKFSLSRREWDSCARRLGRDGASVGRRWRHLVGDGNVGLRPDERV